MTRGQGDLHHSLWFVDDNGPMDTVVAVAAIRELAQLEVHDVRPIQGGWAYWTFDIDGQWIFRFPRTDEVALAAESEQRFLPVLAAHVDFEVPIPKWSGVFNGRSFFGYRKLEGRPLCAADIDQTPGIAERLAAMLHQIHSFDPETAKSLLGAEGSVGAWQRRYQDLRNVAVSRVADLLDPSTASLLDRGFSALLDEDFTFTPTPVHGDLGTEHILVDEYSGRPVGIIDFEDADVGDPAIDFVGFWITLGPERTQRLLDSYPGQVDAGFLHRIKTYWWIGSLHAVIYGFEQDDQAIIADGLTGLRQRLGALDS